MIGQAAVVVGGSRGLNGEESTAQLTMRRVILRSLLLWTLRLLDPIAEGDVGNRGPFMVILDHFQRLLRGSQIDQHQLAKLIADQNVLWPRRMDIDRAYRVALELLALFLEDNVGLLRLTIEHAQLAVRVTDEDELVSKRDARGLASIYLPIDGQLMADVL